MNRSLLLIMLLSVLVGCGEADKTKPTEQLEPADESDPIVTLNKDIPDMPKQPQTNTAPDEKWHKLDSEVQPPQAKTDTTIMPESTELSKSQS